jgi:hypothetical protein
VVQSPNSLHPEYHRWFSPLTPFTQKRAVGTKPLTGSDTQSAGRGRGFTYYIPWLIGLTWCLLKDFLTNMSASTLVKLDTQKNWDMGDKWVEKWWQDADFALSFIGKMGVANITTVSDKTETPWIVVPLRIRWIARFWSIFHPININYVATVGGY